MIVDVRCYIHLRWSCYTQSNSHHFLLPFFFPSFVSSQFLSPLSLSNKIDRYKQLTFSFYFHVCIKVFSTYHFLSLHSPSFVFSQFLKQPKTRPVSSSIIFFWENNTDPRMWCASLNTKYVHKIHLQCFLEEIDLVIWKTFATDRGYMVDASKQGFEFLELPSKFVLCLKFFRFQYFFTSNTVQLFYLLISVGRQVRWQLFNGWPALTLSSVLSYF